MQNPISSAMKAPEAVNVRSAKAISITQPEIYSEMTMIARIPKRAKLVKTSDAKPWVYSRKFAKIARFPQIAKLVKTSDAI
jgi:hypothetical protein